PFTIHAAVAPLHLHSFPTRRSSDLAGLALSGCMPATTYQAAPEATLKPNDKAQLAKARYAVVPPAEPFRRAIVDYHRRELPGTIVVDSDSHYLYLVQDGGKAIRYGVTVGE